MAKQLGKPEAAFLHAQQRAGWIFYTELEELVAAAEKDDEWAKQSPSDTFSFTNNADIEAMGKHGAWLARAAALRLDRVWSLSSLCATFATNDLFSRAHYLQDCGHSAAEAAEVARARLPEILQTVRRRKWALGLMAFPSRFDSYTGEPWVEEAWTVGVEETLQVIADSLPEALAGQRSESLAGINRQLVDLFKKHLFEHTGLTPTYRDIGLFAGGYKSKDASEVKRFVRAGSNLAAVADRSLRVALQQALQGQPPPSQVRERILAMRALYPVKKQENQES